MSELAVIDQAERALALVSTPDEAEEIWRKLSAVAHAARLAKTHAETQLRVGRLKLRAERRWGELLGPPKETQGKRVDLVSDGNKLTLADRVARHHAREVAELPRPIFEKYLAGVRDAERLRRARILRLRREWLAEQRRAEPIEPTAKIGGVEIRHGDLRSALDDLAGEVDAIITDPPYPAEFVPEFDALGEVAANLLAPNGLLVAMVGQAHLPAYLELLSRHLTYRWTAAYLTSGPATRVHGRALATAWKPLLLFDRAEERRFFTRDLFSSPARDKRLHDWGQSEAGMTDIVELFTDPGALVVDPFLGGGTTAVVCRELGRRFVGCDVDSEAVRTSRERLAA